MTTDYPTTSMTTDYPTTSMTTNYPIEESTKMSIEWFINKSTKWSTKHLTSQAVRIEQSIGA